MVHQLNYVTLTTMNESKHQLCVRHIKTNQSTLALMILHSICSAVNKCRSLK